MSTTDHGACAAPRGPVEVLLRRLDPEVPLPAYQHPGDAGCDLVTTESAELAPGERAVLPTGISLALPDGYAAFVHPRSGLAARCGVALVNAPGTVDAGYRGEIKVIVANLDPREAVRFERFDRIAQLVVQQVEKVRFREVEELPTSARAAGGFGSTGGHAAGRTGPEADSAEEAGSIQQTAAQQKHYVAVGADRASDLRGQ
ncbi:dUTP diphosphatase [Streptomyces albus]|uniref:dUTP diphosphatase n=1 Tax=Streptomyces albus TaxID=1888 RepID=UPI0006E46C59|nr:dUTP diphosphatase [Streptomyces albus]